MVSSENVLTGQLKPLCSRDNHVMKYEVGGSRANSGNLASYHCGSIGCSVRYNSTDGYFICGQFGQSKIENLGVSAFGDKNVCRLDVPVHDPFGMRGVQRVGKFNR